MPASMISAATGGTLKVIGNSIAIVASGPMPGNTPISVPISTPMKQYIRFCSEKATPKPKMRLSNSSMTASGAHQEWVGQAEPPDEHDDRHECQPDCQRQHLQEVEFFAGQRGADDHGEARRNEAGMIHQ